MDQKLLDEAGKGNLDQVRDLLAQGANINTNSIYNWKPLHTAADNGHLAVVQYLIEAGANINAVTRDNETPLHKAATWGHLAVVQYLIQTALVNISAVNKLNQTSLHLAAWCGRLPIVEYLIDCGVDRNIKDIHGQTEADVAKTDEIRQVILTRVRPFWSPNIHSWRANAQEKEQIRVLMLIRHQETKILSMIPRELMFEIFQWLVK